MNTKIIVALVIATALVGLTGAASAASYTGYSDYSHTDILDTETPTNLDVNSGTCFHTVIGHFDDSYGYPAQGDPVPVGAGVFNTMYATPVGMGVEHQIATQAGTAGITIRSLDSEDCLPELEAEVTSEQSLWYSGSFTEYSFLTEDKGFAGAYGLKSNGLDFGDPGVDDDCGNIFLMSRSAGEGYTMADDGAKITGGTFSVASFQGMTAELEGVPAGDAIINVYGGAMGASTFTGAVDDWEGIATSIYAEEELTVDTGWSAGFPTMCDCIDP
ncbi:MAG: hypothetical protein N2V75_05485 [Methanophagales archaeon]|nr:hypothetical protein [Methanophagales archaeon]